MKSLFSHVSSPSQLKIRQNTTFRHLSGWITPWKLAKAKPSRFFPNPHCIVIHQYMKHTSRFNRLLKAQSMRFLMAQCQNRNFLIHIRIRLKNLSWLVMNMITPIFSTLMMWKNRLLQKAFTASFAAKSWRLRYPGITLSESNTSREK